MKSCRSIRFFFLFLVLLAALSVPFTGYGLDVPPLKGRVNDTAAMLSPQTMERLETMLANLETSDSTQLVVLTIPSLQGEVLEDYSLRVAETWGVGQKGHDNGALLLISRDDRKLRIEVGYGLEGSLTDLISGRIIGGVIVPRFREGRFDQGIHDGVQAMIQAVKGEFVAADTKSSGKRQQKDPGGLVFFVVVGFAFMSKIFHKKKVAAAIAGGIGAPLLGLIFLSHPTLVVLMLLVPVGAVVGLIAASLSSSGKGGGFYVGPGGFGGSSGGFGGGFSGGGGSFGGGGASGGW
ncbi:MAG: TPM domain-containing protein [Thermodesulfobacteriota bacterium]